MLPWAGFCSTSFSTLRLRNLEHLRFGAKIFEPHAFLSYKQCSRFELPVPNWSLFKICIILPTLECLVKRDTNLLLALLDPKDIRFFRNEESSIIRENTRFRIMADNPALNGRKFLPNKAPMLLSDEQLVLLERWDAGDCLPMLWPRWSYQPSIKLAKKWLD